MKIPKVTNFYSNIKKFSKNPTGFISQCVSTHGDVVDINLSLWFQPKVIVISNLDYIQHILSKNNANYKKDAEYQFLKIPLGNGLLTSDGDF